MSSLCAVSPKTSNAMRESRPIENSCEEVTFTGSGCATENRPARLSESLNKRRSSETRSETPSCESPIDGGARRVSSGLLNKSPDSNTSRSIAAEKSKASAIVAARQSRAPMLTVGMCACGFIRLLALDPARTIPTISRFYLSVSMAMLVSFRRRLRPTAVSARAIIEPGAF